MVTKRSSDPFVPTAQVEESARVAETLQPKGGQEAPKETQIVIRTTEPEKDEIKTYFAKHGLSISKGMNIAYDVLRVLERRGKVDLTKNGYSLTF